MWPAHYEQFGTFQTTMSEGDREVLHITGVKAIQQKINSAYWEKAKHTAAKEKANSVRHRLCSLQSKGSYHLRNPTDQER